MINMSNRRHLEKGFSLLELLVGVAILAVGLLSIQSLENQNIDASNYTNDLSIAMMLANYRLEEEQIKAEFGSFSPPIKSFSQQFPSFKIDVKTDTGIGLPIDLPLNLPPIILVNVSWQFHGNTDNFTLIDYIKTHAMVPQI